jgi:hypothetical protein
MWMRDAFAERTSSGTTELLHIYEKKKPARSAVLPTSSFSKYAHSDRCHRNHREECA